MRRSGGLALLVVAAAVLPAGCGGSGPRAVASVAATTPSRSTTRSHTTPGRPQPEQAALRYARCMRANGVPSFPDPSGDGGFTFPAGGGVDRSSPAFERAQTTCRKYLVGLGGGLTPGTRTHPSARWLATMVAAARCMRRHGVPGFPDPTTTVPSPTVLRGDGQISNIDGAVFVLPAATIDTRSPVFVRAARTCGFPLHNH